jgi:hypothetical protein
MNPKQSMKSQPSESPILTINTRDSTDSLFYSIIAMTGMDGHAYGSWVTKNDRNTMWLRDFLGEDMPHCRTMIYGYQAKLLKNNANTLLEYGREFFAEIKKIRTTEEVRKAIKVKHSSTSLTDSNRIKKGQYFS